MSAAELLYGVPLALPGELLDTAEPPGASFLENLRGSPLSIPTRPLIELSTIYACTNTDTIMN